MFNSDPQRGIRQSAPRLLIYYRVNNFYVYSIKETFIFNVYFDSSKQISRMLVKNFKLISIAELADE